MQQRATGASAISPQRHTVYTPEKRPGFVAWTTAFDYGDGSIGLTFKETLRAPNPHYTEPKLEFSEAVASNVSYSSVTCGSPQQCSSRVYLRSHDSGETWAETGRAPENEGSFCNVGWPDGRITGFNVPDINPEGTAWGHYIEVRESIDGGSTWTLTHKLLEGNAIYLWRVRRLRDGTIILMASLYGTAWGPGCERATRNTMLPDESYISKIQTFFLASTDGQEFSGPHYILPGIGAHEYDMAELDDGSLLFIAGDVQATPVARQKVKRQDGRFINQPLHSIVHGAPDAPETHPQGGFVPETLVRLASGLLVGSRRNKPYSCSVDEGENWFEIDGLPPSLYQPFMLLMPNGRIANFGHFGGDTSFGQADMYIGADFFEVENRLPQACGLLIERCVAEDNSHYENRYRARLMCGTEAVGGQEIEFRFTPAWGTTEEHLQAPPQHAPYLLRAFTGHDGWAEAEVGAYDRAGDIHFAYTVQACYLANVNILQPEGVLYMPCQSATMSVTALRPHRRNAYPYNAYFAEGTLFLAPMVLERCPNAMEELAPLCGRISAAVPAGALKNDLAALLIDAHVLVETSEGLCWIESIHAPTPLAEVLPMADGDWYI